MFSTRTSISPHRTRPWFLAVVVSAAAAGVATAQSTTTWQATATNNWNVAGNWTAGLPGPGFIAAFSTAGATQFDTNNDIVGLTIDGLAVTGTAPQPFTIGGNTFAIGTAAGIDMTAAAQNLTINSGITLGVSQTWNVAAGRVLTVNGVIDGTGGLTVPGAGIVRINSPGQVAFSSYSGGTTITGILEVGWTAATPEDNLRIPATGNSVLGTGPVTVNGGELRLTPLDSAASPIANGGGAQRTINFGANGGLLHFNGRVANGQFPIATTAGATGTAVVRASAFNSNNWGTTGGYVVAGTGISGTGPIRFEMLDGALTTFTATITVDAPFTFQGVDNGSATANRAAITVPGDVNTNPAARTVGRMGIANAGTVVTFNAGLTFRDAVQVTIMNASTTLDGDITLAPTANGTFVAFHGRGTGGAVFDPLVIGTVANARTLTIEGNTGVTLDSRFRPDGSTNIGGVVVNHRVVINPGGLLQFSQSTETTTTGTPGTGFHTVNGTIRGAGTDAADARVLTLLPLKTTTGGAVGGVNWTASTATLEVNGTGTGGLRIEGASADLGVGVADHFLSPARVGTLAGTGGTLTIAPSDNGTTIAVAPAVASAVRLGVGSSGAGPVAVTLGAAANDLQNWAGLVVKGSSGGGTTVANLATNQTFAQTTVLGGTLNVQPAVTLTSPVAVTGGRLGGAGTVGGNVAVSGTGAIAPGDGPGILSVTGGVTYTGGAFVAELNGTTVGTQYDQLAATGTVGLGAGVATLVTSLGYAPAQTDVLTIITAGSVTGEFAGLPNGTVFEVGTFNMTPYSAMITYQSDRVILSQFQPVPEPAGVMAGCAAAGAAGWLRRNRRAGARPGHGSAEGRTRATVLSA